MRRSLTTVALGIGSLAAVVGSPQPVSAEGGVAVRGTDPHLFYAGGEISAVDPATEAIQWWMPIPTAPNFDIALAPTGEFYAIDHGEQASLFRVRFGSNSGLLERVGALGSGIQVGVAVAFDPQGTLYLYGTRTVAPPVHALYTVNTTTGHATHVADIDYGGPSNGDIAFLPDGRLFMTWNGPGSAGSTLLELDRATGHATPRGTIAPPGGAPIADFFGLAAVGNQLYGGTGGNTYRIDSTDGTATMHFPGRGAYGMTGPAAFNAAPGPRPAPTRGVWTFEEGTGTTSDDMSGNGHVARFGQDEQGTDLPSWTSSGADGGLAFDGIDDRVDIDDGGYFGMELYDSFTVEAVFSTTRHGGSVGQGLVNRRGQPYGAGVYSIYITPDGYAAAEARDVNGIDATVISNAFVADGGVHKVTLIRDTSAREFRLYLDGQVVARRADVSRGSFDAGQLVFGRLTPNFDAIESAWPFEGDLFEVKVVKAVEEPLQPARDSDGDGLTDDEETPSGTGTDPLNPDTDRDALLDGWEVKGYTYADGRYIAAVDLTTLDPASPPNAVHQKDVYVWIDYMEGHRPDPTDFSQVASAFRNKGVSLHIYISPRSLPHDDGVLGTPAPLAADRSGYNWDEFDALRLGHFPPELGLSVHYCMFVHDLPIMRPNETIEGISRDGAAHFIVAMGNEEGVAGLDELRSVQSLKRARIFMHELGHNLGLLHGGNDNVHRKPNYVSIMNYLFSGTGIPHATDDNIRILDYSSVALPPLDESRLLESAGIGAPPELASYATAWYTAVPNRLWTAPCVGAIDWNKNGTRDDPIPMPFELNRDPTNGLTFAPLQGHDDWDRLQFRYGSIGGLLVSPAPQVTLADELPVEMARELGPAPPRRLKCHSRSGYVALGWTRPRSLAQRSFHVYRSAGDERFQLVGGTDAHRFVDRNVAAGATYRYTVITVQRPGIEGPPSAVVSCTVRACSGGTHGADEERLSILSDEDDGEVTDNDRALPDQE